MQKSEIKEFKTRGIDVLSGSSIKYLEEPMIQIEVCVFCVGFSMN